MYMFLFVCSCKDVSTVVRMCVSVCYCAKNECFWGGVREGGCVSASECGCACACVTSFHTHSHAHLFSHCACSPLFCLIEVVYVFFYSLLSL